ncbi:MAG: hypothetical protein AB1774_06435 [Bacillota bacterium]
MKIECATLWVLRHPPDVAVEGLIRLDDYNSLYVRVVGDVGYLLRMLCGE